MNTLQIHYTTILHKILLEKPKPLSKAAQYKQLDLNSNLQDDVIY